MEEVPRRTLPEGRSRGQPFSRSRVGRRVLFRGDEVVDGQVHTIRIHLIHGSESTAVLRFLYRKSEN